MNDKNYSDVKLSAAPLSTNLSMRRKDERKEDQLFPQINTNLL